MDLQRRLDRVCFVLLVVSTLAAAGLGLWGVWDEGARSPAFGKLLTSSVIVAFASGWLLSACRLRAGAR